MTKNKQTSVFWRLLSYLKSYRLLTILALSFLLLTTLVRSLIPLLASYFIDHYISSISETAVAILAAYFALYLLQMLLQYFGNLWFAKVSYSIVRDIRRDAFGRMEKLGWLTLTRLRAVPLYRESPMIRRAFQRCFQGFYPVLSPPSLLSSPLFQPCLLWIGN